MQHFNKLTPAEAERLAILAEECSEVIQVVGKILRHGYESSHPDHGDRTNRVLLTDELGHVMAAMHMLDVSGDAMTPDVKVSMDSKLMRIGRYLHHASVTA